ncbi:MAG: hypothetical protein IKK49_01365, partial [Clostridia bacterium]|nr:hypothetical protein [Clostridia bacterium]
LDIVVTLIAFPLRGRFPHGVGEMSQSDKGGRLRQRGTAAQRWMRWKRVRQTAICRDVKIENVIAVPCFILRLTFCRGGYYPPVLITLSLLAADSRPYCDMHTKIFSISKRL